jgi:penicillin-binding protein 1A
MIFFKTLKRVFFTLLFIGFISPFLILGYYLNLGDYDISTLTNYKPDTTTRLYDKNGEKIANIFNEKHRYYATFNEIPTRAIEALVAIEDTSFFEHGGINFNAIFRAIIKDVKAGKMVEGASTITQQLIKNMLLTREKKLSRKIKELIYSIKIEKYLTKEKILEIYLNEIYFGHGYYGIKTAASGYFHKKLKELTLKEIAILVGLPKAPSSYAPTKNYEISMGRANRVVKRMHVLGWIDQVTYEIATHESPKVYNDTLTQNLAPFIVDEVIRRMNTLGIDDFKTAGYDIYTSIDIRLQQSARTAIKNAYDASLKRIDEYIIKDEKLSKKYSWYKASDEVNTTRLNGSLVSLDSKTGDILALVGSYDYKISPYNRATQGRRQPGSAFKPFIYQVAIDLGYSGSTRLVDIAKTYEYTKGEKVIKWQPRNYEKDYKGLVSLREALVHSRNLATINLVNEIGLNELLKEFKKFGIKNLPHDLSISLGTISLSPLELAKYFTSFANHGLQVEPQLIMSIEKNHQQIYKKVEHSRFITTPAQTFIMTSMLRDVVNRGTGRRARVKGIELAGKTGTTNNNVDGWFAGYSPSIETIVWFGNDDNKPMHKKETGGKIAAPAFAEYYKSVLEYYPQVQRKFKMPEGIVKVKIDGKEEFFSDVSKPPVEDRASPDEELIF